ncbi:MAG: hypothetical protein AABX37_05090 [Nanoarchaeota archaeon]
MGGGTFPQVAPLPLDVRTTLEDRVTESKQPLSVEEANLSDKTELLEHVPSIAYSFEEEQFRLGLQYGAPPLDYMRLWYGDPSEKGKFAPDKEYVTEMPKATDTESGLLTAEEAQEAIVDIQYATVMGSPHDVDAETRRKVDLWIKFNPALFQAFESAYGVTREVNYGGI